VGKERRWAESLLSGMGAYTRLAGRAQLGEKFAGHFGPRINAAEGDARWPTQGGNKHVDGGTGHSRHPAGRGARNVVHRGGHQVTQGRKEKAVKTRTTPQGTEATRYVIRAWLLIQNSKLCVTDTMRMGCATDSRLESDAACSGREPSGRVGPGRVRNTVGRGRTTMTWSAPRSEPPR